MSERSIAEIVEKRLAAYLGRHTAKTAVRTFAQKALGVDPAGLLPAHVPTLLAALRPMLRTLLGSDHGDAVVRVIEQDCA